MDKPKSHSLMELSIAQERLRQARQSFNLALTMTVISFFVSLVGGILLISGKVSEGAITSASGLASSIQFLKFANETNDRLDKILSSSSGRSSGVKVTMYFFFGFNAKLLLELYSNFLFGVRTN
jgi:hypothetical protein